MAATLRFLIWWVSSQCKQYRVWNAVRFPLYTRAEGEEISYLQKPVTHSHTQDKLPLIQSHVWRWRSAWVKLSRTDGVGIFQRTERRQECRWAAAAMWAQQSPQWGRKEVHWIPVGHPPELIGFPFKPEQERAYHFSRSGCFPRQEIYCFKLMPWNTQLCMLFVLDTEAWINRSDSKELSTLLSQVWVKRTLQMLSDVTANHPLLRHKITLCSPWQLHLLRMASVRTIEDSFVWIKLPY